VERLTESLQAALFTYQTVATRKRPGSSAFRPVLQPDLKHSPNLASGPTLRTAAAYLKDAVKSLAGRLQDVDSLSQMIENFDNISSDEIIEVRPFFEFLLIQADVERDY
jgi:nuclear pore complex protein Nup205